MDHFGTPPDGTPITAENKLKNIEYSVYFNDPNRGAIRYTYKQIYSIGK